MRFEPFSLGKYQFVELLGKGGMGEIYLVKVSGSQGFLKQFAVKRLIPAGTERKNTVLAFEQEARLTSMLTHPNIAQVYDFVRTGKSSLLVMEYVHGKNLIQILRQAGKREKKLPIPFAVYVAIQVSRGLYYAHNKKHPDTDQFLGIVHRDVSPQNIMVAFDGNVKLIDFGVARIDNQAFKTATGFVKGKPRYMSPEQARGQVVDKRTDIYGLGLVLLESLTGLPAFNGATNLETFKKVQSGIWSEELIKENQIPKALECIIRCSLKTEPSERFESALEMASKLEEFMRSEYPGYGEREVGEYLNELYGGQIQNSESNREVVPFTLAEKRCVERGGLEESNLTPTPNEKKPFWNFEPRSLIQSELTWILGFFVLALTLSGGFLGYQYMKLKQKREIAGSVSSQRN